MKNNMGMRAVDVAQAKEVKEYLQEETRSANLFNFEQMLELEMSMKDSASFYDGTSTVLNSIVTSDNEEGNHEIFEKMTRKNRVSRFKKAKKAIKSTDSKGKKTHFSPSPPKSRFAASPMMGKRKVSLKQSDYMIKIKKRMMRHQKKGGIKNMKARKCKSPELDMSKAHLLFID